MASFSLRIISSTRIFYEGPCRCLIVPAPDGEKAILAHHEEMILALREGEMRMQIEDGGEWSYAVISPGFCQVAHNRVTLLADTVERPEEIDAVRAREALERAEELYLNAARRMFRMLRTGQRASRGTSGRIEQRNSPQ